MTTTQGPMPVTPAVLTTTASLQQIREAAKKAKYAKAGPPSTGWGSIWDGDGPLAKATKQRPGFQVPELLENLPGSYPDQVRARFYWDEPLPSAEAELGDDKWHIYEFRAADVTISPRGTANKFLVLLGERKAGRIKDFVQPGIEQLLADVDQSAKLSLDDDPLSLGNHDFYFWLLYRGNGDADVTHDLTITDLMAAKCQDVSFRPTLLSRGVDLDRDPLLAMLADHASKFGPVKLAVRSKRLKLRVGLDLDPEKSFALLRGESSYQTDSAPTGQDLGPALLMDVAYHVLPELVSAYTSDSAWLNGGRDQFRLTCRTTLKGKL